MELRTIWIDSAHAGEDRVFELLTVVGLAVERTTDPTEALELARGGAAVGLFLLGPELARPLEIGRRLHASHPSTSLAFLTWEEHDVLAQRLAESTARIGSRWDVVRLGASDVRTALAEVHRSAEQFQRFRTTLNRVSHQLTEATPPEISAFRLQTISDRFLSKILAEAHEGILTASAERAIVTVNGAAEQLLGIEAAAALGKPLVDVAPEPWSTRVGPLFDELEAATGRAAVCELGLDVPVGERVHLEVVLSAVVAEAGDTIGYALILRDIGERRRLEEQRLELERRSLEARRMEALGIVAGGVAHDFNNLLTSILGNTEMVLRDLPDGTVPSTRLASALSAAHSAAEICDQLLAYTGRGLHHFEAVSVTRTVESALERFAGSVPARVVLRSELDRDLPPVRSDPSQLERVLIHLLTNSLEALHEASGTILVRARQASEGAAMIELTVSDDGCGMPAATRERAFEPFFSTKFVGRGLGLAVVEGVMRTIGGSVGLSSAEGVGTTITLLLPANGARESSRD